MAHQPADAHSDRPVARAAGLFGARALPAAPQPAEPAPPRRSARPARWLVPLVLFMLIIGAIAWFLQNVPAGRSKQSAAAPKLAVIGDLLQPGLIPDEKKEGGYIPEFEKGHKGRRLYPIKNVGTEPVELMLFRVECDCSRMEYCLIPEAEWHKVVALLEADFNAVVPEDPKWAWQAMVRHETTVTVPGGAFALLGMAWEARKDPGSSLNLGASLAARSSTTAPQALGLCAKAVVRRPLEMRPDHVPIGTLEPGGKGEATVLLWSPTRDHVDFKIKDKHDDGLVVMQTRRLDAAECAKLQKSLAAEEVHTKVRCAFELKVTVHEQKGSQQLPQGPLYRVVDVEVEDAAEARPPLVLGGYVRGDVQVGGSEDQGKVQLKSFRAADGTRKTVVIRSDLKTELTIERHAPAALEVTLKESVKERNAVHRKWLLEVVVPPNAHFGPFDEEHVIQLKTGVQPPRRIRIPLAGHAVQG